MDAIFPHGKDVQLCRPIRSQKFTLSDAEGHVLIDPRRGSRRALSIELRVRGGEIVAF